MPMDSIVRVPNLASQILRGYVHPWRRSAAALGSGRLDPGSAASLGSDKRIKQGPVARSSGCEPPSAGVFWASEEAMPEETVGQQSELPLPFPELAGDMPLLPARMLNEYQ